MVDDCHATGFIGKHGRGTAEHWGVTGRVDIITGTFGKALGGGQGGFTASHREVIDLLRQRSRPYLFSNTLVPEVVGGSLAVLKRLSETTALRDKLEPTRATSASRSRSWASRSSRLDPIVRSCSTTRCWRRRSRRISWRRDLRDRLSSTRWWQWRSADPRADLRRARARAPRPLPRGVREGGAPARSDIVGRNGRGDRV